MTPNPRTIAGGIAAAVLGSGVTAALLLAPNATSAASTPTSTEVTSSTDDTSGGTTGSGSTSDQTDALRDALQPLVDAGVLTAAQADNLANELRDVVPQFHVEIGPDVQAGPGLPGMPGMPGMPGRHQEIGPLARLTQHSAGVIADTIGIDQADLITQLRDGKTVAEIAQDNGVDPQAVIDALVNDYTQRVTDFVNGDTGSTTDGESATTTPTTEAAA
jgi:hypothetical protein